MWTELAAWSNLQAKIDLDVIEPTERGLAEFMRDGLTLYPDCALSSQAHSERPTPLRGWPEISVGGLDWFHVHNIIFVV